MVIKNYLQFHLLVLLGQDEQIKAFGSEIGRIVKLKTTEHGIRYEQPPSLPQLKFITNGIVTNVLGTFVSEEQISGTTSGFTADVISFDAVRGLIKLENVSGTPTLGERITGGLSGAQATFLKSDVASATVDVVSSIETDGLYINEDGHVSENTMKIQDSLLYQDFSYIIKVGESINTWRDSFKKTMHASGFILQVKLLLKIEFQVVLNHQSKEFKLVFKRVLFSISYLQSLQHLLVVEWVLKQMAQLYEVIHNLVFQQLQVCLVK